MTIQYIILTIYHEPPSRVYGRCFFSNPDFFGATVVLEFGGCKFGISSCQGLSAGFGWGPQGLQVNMFPPYSHCLTW